MGSGNGTKFEENSNSLSAGSIFPLPTIRTNSHDLADQINDHSLIANWGRFRDEPAVSNIDINKREELFRIMEEAGTGNIPSISDVQIYLKRSNRRASEMVKELQRANIINKKFPKPRKAHKIPPKLSPIILTNQSVSDVDSSASPNPIPNSPRSSSLPLVLNNLKDLSTELSSTPLRARGGSSGKRSSLCIEVEDLILQQKYLKVDEVYETVSRVGSGSFGVVYKVRHRLTGQIRALKKILKELYPVNLDPSLEYKILKTLDHPHILRLIEYWESDNHYYLVSEYMRGNSLTNYLNKYKRLGEEKVAIIIESILKAVTYCHSRNITHRDLKLDNIMFDENDEISSLKVIDFGCSVLMQNRHKVRNIAGTAQFMPPEAKTKMSGQKTDIWALGIIMYALLAGSFPFEGMTMHQFYQIIKHRHLQLSGEIWDDISIQCKRLIRGLLEYDVDRRLSAKLALQSPWLNNRKLAIDSHSIATQSLASLDNLYLFKQTSDIERLILSYLSTQFRTKLYEENIKKYFEFFDRDNKGFITKISLFQIIKEYTNLPEGDIQGTVRDIFDIVDLNQDGEIAYSEFLLANLDWESIMTESNLKSTFKRFDNGNKEYVCAEDFKLIFSENENLKEQNWNLLFQEGFEKNERISFFQFYSIMRSFLVEQTPNTSKNYLKSSCFTSVIEELYPEC